MPADYEVLICHSTTLPGTIWDLVDVAVNFFSRIDGITLG